MLNVPELEKKWLTYKIRSFIPYIALMIILVVIIPLTIIFYPSKQESSKTIEIATSKSIQQDNRTKSNAELSSIEQIDKREVNVSNETKEDEKLVLKPSLNFVNKIEDSMITYYDDDKHTNHKEPKKVSKAKIQTKQTDDVKVASNNTPETKQDEDSSEKITIKTHSVDKNMQDVIQRFKKTNNPVLSLFLAKKYYEMKQYDLSYNYALITNQIDNKIDMSWIIFAKSLVKLGQKDMAVNTLKSYIKNSSSQTAITLLDEIESGRFQ